MAAGIKVGNGVKGAPQNRFVFDLDVDGQGDGPYADAIIIIGFQAPLLRASGNADGTQVDNVPGGGYAFTFVGQGNGGTAVIETFADDGVWEQVALSAIGGGASGNPVFAAGSPGARGSFVRAAGIIQGSSVRARFSGGTGTPSVYVSMGAI